MKDQGHRNRNIYDFAVFLIVGGIGQNGNEQLDTEVIDLSNTTNYYFGEIPEGRSTTVGGLLGTNSQPIYCGGDTDLSCFTYTHWSQEWTQTHTLTIARGGSASVQVNSTTLWIIGGYNYTGSGDSTEFIGIDSSVGIPGPKLPIPLDNTCAVKYAEDQIFVIGGVNSIPSESGWSKVFIFNPLNGFTHVEGPSLKIGRCSHSCGLMSNGPDKKIVVAGGFAYDDQITDKLSDVEIFDPYIKDWITGNKYIVLKIYI